MPQLPAMIALIKINTGRQAEELSADAGYLSEANLRELKRRHIRRFITTGRQRHSAVPTPPPNPLAAARRSHRRAPEQPRHRSRRHRGSAPHGSRTGLRDSLLAIRAGLREGPETTSRVTRRGCPAKERG